MGLMKKLTSALVASSLVFSLAATTAAAAYTPDAGNAAGSRMQALHIIQGRPGDGLALNSEITRAELVTVIVRAFGKEEDAKLLAGSNVFPDTANHWASGNIAMAAALVAKMGADPIGMPDGTFNPEGKLTPAQAVAFLMKFVGVKRDASKAWPNDYLDKAVEAGLITAEDKALIAPMANQNSTRSLVFYLFDRAFFSYKLATGNTFYTQYVDTMAPGLTLKDVAATTTDSKVTVSGTATDATEVYVGTTKVTTDASGNFSADYNLPEVKADPYKITVTALDLAGNKTEKSVQVTRTTGAAAAIEASDITVAAGATADVTVTVKDAKGNVLAGQAVTGTSAVGTFDAGKFTAGKTAGTGTLTLKLGDLTKDVKVTVNAGALATVEAASTSAAKGEFVTLTTKDANGNAITGATFTVDSANAVVTPAGQFIGSAFGTYTVTAKLGDASATVKIGVYDKANNVKITTAPASIVANDDTTKAVEVTIVDANGNLVANSEEYVGLKADGVTVFKANGSAYDDLVGVKAVGGVAKFTVSVKPEYAGQVVTLTARPMVAANFKASDPTGTSDITPKAQEATTVKVTAPKYLANGAGAKDVTVDVLDQEGVKMIAGTWTVNFTVAGPATLADGKTANTSTSYIDGAAATYSVVPTTGVTGDVTYTATIDGIGVATGTSKNVYAADPAKITLTAKDDKVSRTVSDQAADILTFTVQLVDANGVPVSKAGTSFTIDAGKDADGNAIDLADAAAYITTGITGGDTVTLDDGTGKATVTIASTIAQTLNLTFKNDDYTGGTIALTYTPADPTLVALTRYNSIAVPVTNDTPKADLSAQLYDKFGNKVQKADVKVTFTAYSDAGLTTKTDEVSFNGTVKTLAVKTGANGVATVTATTRPFGGTSYYVAVNGSDDLALAELAAGEADVTLNVVSKIATTVEVKVYDATTGNLVSTSKAGTDVFIRATVKDQYGAKMDDQAAYLGLKLAAKVLWDGAALTDKLPAGTAWEYNAADKNYVIANTGTHAETAVTLGKSGMQALGVKDTANATDIAGSYNVTVQAGAFAAVKVTQADSDNAVSGTHGTVAGPFTVQLTDAYGNNVSLNADQKVYLSSSSANVSFRTAVDGVNVTSVSSRNSKNVYFVISSAAAADDTYTINFGSTAGGTEYGTLTLNVK